MPDSNSKPDIETGADTLLSFLEEKTKWPVSKIADEMGVPNKTVKKWAKALEKSGLVEIKYSAIKGMVLEYASDKTYEELNKGRSELALEADELEIEAEEVETVEEEGETAVADTEHKESEETKEEDNTSGKEDNAEELQQEDENDLKPAEELSEEEGKEKLKQELESLENEKKGKEKSDSAKMKADKAKIKNSSDNNEDKKDQEDSEKGEDSSGSTKAKLKAGKAKIRKSGSEGGKRDEESHESAVRKVADKVKSQSRKDVDHEAGSNLDDILNSIEELGDLLENDEIGNDEVYGRMEHEMEALKETLVEEEITDERKKKVAETMEKVEIDIQNASDQKSVIQKLVDYLKKIKW